MTVHNVYDEAYEAALVHFGLNLTETRLKSLQYKLLDETTNSIKLALKTLGKYMKLKRTLWNPMEP